jgi:hypothetical protein
MVAYGISAQRAFDILWRAERAVFVGDATWDARACAGAYVISIGVLSGGLSRIWIENAGTATAFAKPDHLLRDLERTPIRRLATVGCCWRSEWAQPVGRAGPIRPTGLLVCLLTLL